MKTVSFSKLLCDIYSKTKIIICVMVLCPILGLAQSCVFDTLVINSSEDLNAFQMNFSDCTIIEGNIVVANASDITDLDAFLTIEHINGSLSISDLWNLQSTEGLENLKSVHDFSLRDCVQLTSLKGIENLEFVYGDLHIEGLTELEEWPSLHALSRIDGSLSVVNNISIQQLPAFPSLEKIEGELRIENNSLFQEFGRFDQLKEIGGGIQIKENNQFESFQDVFPKLEKIGSFELTGSYVIQNMEGLDSINEISGDIIFRDNSALISIEGLHFSKVHGDFVIETCSGLALLSHLTTLDTIYGNFMLSAVGQLISIEGLSALKFVGGSLIIRQADNLNSLFGLEGLSEIGDSLIIEQNLFLFEIESLSNLRKVSNIRFDGNLFLKNLIGLEGLTEVEGDVVILGNFVLPNLIGLGGLRSIGGDFNVSANAALLSFFGLDSLSHIGGNLKINQNLELLSILDLNTLKEVGGDLVVDFNFRLNSLIGLSSLEKVQGAVQFNNLSSIEDLRGLESLESCRSFSVTNSGVRHLDALENLSTFDSLYLALNNDLERIDGLLSHSPKPTFVSIQNNESLLSLSGLDNFQFDEADASIFIVSNENLEHCAVNYVCEVLEEVDPLISLIILNGSNCEDRETVLQLCNMPTSFDSNHNGELMVFPNPLGDILYFNSQLNDQYVIFDALGRIRSTGLLLQESMIDVSELLSGVYFLELKGRGRSGFKFVKH